MKRRHFLQNTVQLLAWAFSGFPLFGHLRAQETNQDSPLSVESDSDAPHPMHQSIVRALGDYQQIKQARGISLALPTKIEFLGAVPIQVEAPKRQDIKKIAILIDQNREPIVVVSEFSQFSDIYLSVRANVERRSMVRAIAKTEEGLEEIALMLEIDALRLNYSQ